MQNWYSHEEYLRLYNQSRILAEQRSQLEGPFFSNSQTVSPGGNPGIESAPQPDPYKLSLTYDVGDPSLKPYIQIVINAGSDQVMHFNWGDGDETDVTIIPSVLNTINSKSYSTAGSYAVEVSVPDPQRLTGLYIYDRVSSANLTSISGPTGPILGNNLEFLDLQTNSLTYVDLSNLTSLKSLNLKDNQLVSLDISQSSSTLQTIELSENTTLMDIFLSPLEVCQMFNAQSCALNPSTVDGIIEAIAAGSSTGGNINLSGGGNAPPTPSSATALDTLVNLRGWTVITN
jgi:hypothetical protein